MDDEVGGVAPISDEQIEKLELSFGYSDDDYESLVNAFRNAWPSIICRLRSQSAEIAELRQSLVNQAETIAGLRAEVEALENPGAMARYTEGRMGEYLLDKAVIDAFGGISNLPFADWWFDDYDCSAEIGDCPVGLEPTAAQLQSLRAVGIAKLYVNYADETARVWRTDGSLSGECRHKSNENDRRAIVQRIEREIVTLRNALPALLEERAAMKRELAEARAKALEEAACECEDARVFSAGDYQGDDGRETLRQAAADIRRLAAAGSES